MKIIEALKQVKANKKEIDDLHRKISAHSAHTSIQTPEYQDMTAKISEWLQGASQLSKNNCKLLTAIWRTNNATMITIDIDGEEITQSISYWLLRKQEYADIDINIWKALTDRGLQDQRARIGSNPQDIIDVKLVRNYNPELRDKMIKRYSYEKTAIDAKLEIACAITDLME